MTSATPSDGKATVSGLEHLGRGRYPEPLATDGVGVVTVGTGLWGVALVVELLFYGRLDEAGMLWWIPASVTGLVLGLVGLAYCVRRRHSLRAEGEEALAAALRGERVESPFPTAAPPRRDRQEGDDPPTEG